jgi:carboxyl-terminal processing protease
VKATGKVALQSVAGVRGQPLGAAPVVGELDKGSVVEKLGTFGPYTKVGLGDDRFGFVETKALKDGAAGALKVALKPLLTHSPPLLEVTPAKLAVRDAKVHLEGQANDSDKVLDAFIFVGSRKVFYQSNRKAEDPTKLKFSLDTELQPGVNIITVVARESEDTTSRYTMIVRRDGPNGEALKTTRGEALGDDLGLDSE